MEPPAHPPAAAVEGAEIETGGSEDRSAGLERSREFGKALKATPTLQRLAAAEQRFRSDPDVQRIREELQRHLATFQRTQQAGTLQEGHVRGVREAQARLQDHPVVAEFLEARQAVSLFLQETNRAISEILGLDFAQTVRPAGGACCG